VSSGIWSAASGAIANLTAMDVAATNAANVDTRGYRAEHTIFREMIGKTNPNLPGNVDGRDLRYSFIDETGTDSKNGATIVTGRPLDGALQGEGFFAVSTTRGERFTRSGAIQVGADGTLTDNNGNPYLSAGGGPIVVPPNAKKAEISPDGTILVNGAAAGRLKVVKPEAGAQLVREGHLHFDIRGGTTPVATPRIEPGAVEGSNVSAVKAMLEIVSANRAYDACQRAIESFSEADKKAAAGLMKG
jgi:flagellar basal-body rod protein FlgF